MPDCWPLMEKVDQTFWREVFWHHVWSNKVMKVDDMHEVEWMIDVVFLVTDEASRVLCSRHA